MLSTLKAEAGADLKDKEHCEKVRAENSREAVVTSRAIDEITDKIAKLLKEIEEIVAEVAEKKAAIEEHKKALKEATELREAEHAEWLKTDKDDGDAAELVKQAKEVLEEFYADNKLVLAQGGQPEVEAGKAPPPPPT